jgi:uncharacterized protein
MTTKLRIIPVFFIYLYQMGISPFFGPTCRFHPTCSEYARLAILKYGLVRGCLKALVRISKCHPFHPGGYDPVE